jgi:hypothetical protein
VRGEIASARSVYDENCDRVAELERARRAMPRPDREKAAVAWLREQVFRDRLPCEPNPREYLCGQIEEMLAHWYLWWSQEGLFNHALVLRHFEKRDQTLPLTMAIWPGGTTRLQPHLTWIRRTCGAGRAVMVFEPSGIGAIAPHASGDPLSLFGAIHKLGDDLLWLGDSLTALRAYDVTRAVDVLPLIPHIDADGLMLYGFGRYAVYGQLAAALDSRIAGMEVARGMGSYAEWVKQRHFDSHDIRSVILPGMLQHFDLPDLERRSEES